QTPVAYLILVPWKVLFNPWALVTATLVEHNLSTVLITAPTVFYGGKYLERAWGSSEFAKFMLVVALMTNLALTVIYVLWSLVVEDIASLVPEHTVTVLKGVFKMRVKHFPAVFIVLNAIGSLLIFKNVAMFNLSWIGLVVSWTYLRFFKRQPDLSGTSTSPRATIKGDASDIFAFACFFPDVMQPAVSSVTDKIYDIFVQLKIIKPWTDELIASSNEQAVARGQAGLPSLLNSGGRSRKREEAERRRALALKALDQRLQAASAQRAAQRKADEVLSSSSAGPSQQSQTAPASAADSSGEGVLGQTNYSPGSIAGFMRNEITFLNNIL
ncbi:pre-mRNA-splicing factor rse1, partial [Ascosphaera pollenicola]